jgi:hypothetical protein
MSMYKVVNKCTSSLMSGRHVGHYKAAATGPLLLELHSTMMSIPYMAGFSPAQWQKVVDIMLEKTPREPKIHHLRIIALLKSDFNQVNHVLFARQLGHQLEDSDLILHIQYGSRHGKLCQSVVLNKHQTYNIIFRTKQTAAIIENDAIGCYDHLANIVLLLQIR